MNIGYATEAIDLDRRRLLGSATTSMVFAATASQPLAAAPTDAAIRPFHISVPEPQLVDLRRKSLRVKRKTFVPMVVVLLAGAAVNTVSAFGQAHEGAVAITGVKMPTGFRDWRLISVAHEAGKLNDLRAVLGNDTAINATREGKVPYPDGTIIARLAWRYDPLPGSEKAFGRVQSFVSGPPANGVQFMVKDSIKYAASGGWGFVQFDDGKPSGEAVQKSCFPCHSIAKARDFVFSHYAP